MGAWGARRVIAVAIATGLIGACFVQSPVMRFGGGKSSKEVQHDTVTRSTPPALIANSTWPGEVSVARVRVWADDAYRAQNVRWQAAFADQLAYANEVLAAELGVRLEAEYGAWSRHVPASTLAQTLEALAAHDPGEDALAVIGLTSALGLVATRFDQLGVARQPGRHLVVRGYADVHERLLFDRTLPDIPVDERATLAHARRRHKLAAVLLHEIGHNLGAPHDAEPALLMSPTYSDQTAAFSAPSRDVMLATLDQRLGRKRVVAQTRPATTTPARAQLLITLDDAGDRFVGGQQLDDATLDELLQLSVADDPDTEVVIRTGRKTPPHRVAHVVERAKANGVRHVSLTR
jgi:biopolymer transport protein ExbD